MDTNFGPGVGWIGIDQKGSKIKGGKHGSYYEFLWDEGAYAYGEFSGKATATGFTASGDAGGNCKVKMIGAFGTDNNIVGTYQTNGAKSCKKEDFAAAGTFNLPYDPSGCVFVTP